MKSAADSGNFRGGRTGRISGTRELVFPGLPYVVVCLIKEEVIEVIRIYHGAQDWPLESEAIS